MDKLRLKNYRCLEDTGEVEIKPLTLLVGANSSGKSSFLKFFPLLKQSVKERVDGVLFWNGEYVDFESFNNTVHKGDNCIEINYLIESIPLYLPIGIKNINVCFEISVNDKGLDYLKMVHILYEEVDAKYEFSPNSNECIVTVNGIKSTTRKDKIVVKEEYAGIFPELNFEYLNGKYKNYSPVSYEIQEQIFGEKDLKKPHIWGTRYMPTILHKSRAKSFISKILNGLTANEIDEKANLVLYSYSLILLRRINDYFSDLSSHIKYIGPLRLNTERYYRIQNKKIDELTPDGDNLALLLNSYKLNDNNILDVFNEWLDGLFQFTIEVETPPGHIELKIINKEGCKFNLVDVGFGYTQILPILTLIWQTFYKINNTPKNRYCKFSTIAIEQPELHLHPRFQRLFAEMLVKVITEYSDTLRIIIETHSDVIINTIGEYIGNNDFQSDDINIVLFGINSSNELKQTTYDEDGILKEWPIGFFE